MNEGRTTAIFFVVAAVAFGLAWWSRPAPIINEEQIASSRIGQDVFPDFDDPEAAYTLQIANYDEELAQLDRFEVARDQQTNLWTLPSHDDYPADAAEQVKDATTPLIGLRVLDVVSDLRSDHEMYGVVNPDDEQLAAGTSGVGMLVTLKDDKDSVMASLVIGKEVEGVEGQRFVRIPTEDAVYQVELALDAFSTNFRDWIEGELLGVRSFDITRIGVRDYELQQQSLTTMALNRLFDAEVAYDSSAGEWNLASYQVYEGGQPQAAELGESESLNKEYLNAMRTAAQDLEIVDVKRKPTGLAADLKADEALLQDEQSVASLQTQGFYPAGGADGTEIFAAGGETIIGTDEGVRYVLRFGEATASLASLGEDGDGGLSRYLLVTTRLDDAKFPFPDLEVAPNSVEEMLAREKGEDIEQPDTDDTGRAESDSTEQGNASDDDVDIEAETPAEDETENPADVGETAEVGSDESDDDSAEAIPDDGSDCVSDNAQTADEQSEDEQSEDEQSEDTPADDSRADEDATTDEEANDTQPDAAESDAGQESTAEETTANAGDSESAEPEQEGATASEQQVESAQEEEAAHDEATANDDKGDDAADESSASNDEEPAETEEELRERLEALREEIAKENQRKIDERNEKLEEGRKKVQELNTRFSEWYYVVSDSEYGKLRLTRENLTTSDTESDAGPASTAPGGLGLPGLQPQQLLP